MGDQLTFEEVDALLRYEAETGKLYWKERPQEMFPTVRTAKIWNTKFSGKEAFRIDEASGYKKGAILSEKHRAHRVAWLLQTGKWPEGQIDHVNGDKLDNRFSNLRDVSAADNQKNRRRGVNNSSGVLGVSWSKKEKRWRAYARCDGTLKYLGSYKEFGHAVLAREAATVSLGFHPNHGRIV